MRSPKVGLLTFHFTDNPGSALQAYALQKVVQGIGAECEMINYQKHGWAAKANRQYLPALRKQYGFLGFFLWAGMLPVLYFRRKSFEQFQNKYIKTNGRTVCKRRQLPAIAQDYDKLIVGSDQIWNTTNVKVDDTYFLDFVSDRNKKISYAASFGLEALPDSIAERITPLLNDIKYISVRERQGQDIVARLTGKTPALVLDPSLLIDREQWTKIAEIPKESNYIFVYLRKMSPTIARFTAELSSKTGMQIIQVTGIRKRVSQGKRVRSPGPCQWLGYFLNAGFIVTNSFHGIAFSLNFNKQFFVEPITGSQQENNSRIFSILEQFGLRDRIVDSDFNINNIDSIDFEKLNARMNEKRTRSMEFLKNALFDGEG